MTARRARLVYNRGCILPSPKSPVNPEHIGFAAATLTTFSFVPQVLLVWRNRSADGVSTGMYLIFIAGIALWFLYGLSLGSLPIIFANGLTLALASSVLLMKWHFERRARR